MKYLIILLSLFAVSAYAGNYGDNLWTYSHPTDDGGYIEYAPGRIPITVKPIGEGWMRYNPNAFPVAPPRTWRQWESHRKNHILPHVH